MAVGVGWGAGAFPELANEGPDLLFQWFGDLCRWLGGGGVYAPTECPDCERIVSVKPTGTEIMCHQTCLGRHRVWIEPPRAAGRLCRTCGSREGVDWRSGLCSRCSSLDLMHELFLDAAWVRAVYDTSPGAWERSPLTRAIQRFKGKDRDPADQRYALGLASLFLSFTFSLWHRSHGHRVSHENVAFHPLPGIVVPVPSSRGSFAARGFNPVEQLLTALVSPLLIREEHTASGKEIPTDLVLERPWSDIRDLVNGIELDAGRRWHFLNALENEGASIHGSASGKDVVDPISLRPETAKAIVGKTIFLVDDVITTGTTLNRCARVLKKAGAQRVEALALARSFRIPTPPALMAGECPICGGELMLKHRRKDGHPFYGCMNWRADGTGCPYAADAPAGS
jgi:predicted amidophosphoribosyltransferase